jgi:hypothetical protein
MPGATNAAVAANAQVLTSNVLSLISILFSPPLIGRSSGEGSHPVETVFFVASQCAL